MTDPTPPPASVPRRWVWPLVGSLVVILAAGAGWWAFRAADRSSALALARAGQFDDAAPRLQGVLARSPRDPAVLAALVTGYLHEEDTAAALPLLDRWCELRPNDPEPLRLRMDLHRKEQRFDAALADALRLLDLDPDSDTLPLTVAGLSFSAGDFAQAEKRCRELLARQPRRRDARRLLAESLRARGQREEAAAVLDTLLREQPGDTAVMLGRGSLYVEMRDPERAIPLLEAVVRLDPRRQRTGRYQLVLAYEQAGRSADARRVQAELSALQESEVLRDALGSQPNNPDVQARAARAWLAGPQAPQALDLLGRVLDKHPDHAGAHAALAEYYERIGQPGRAAEHRQRAGGEP